MTTTLATAPRVFRTADATYKPGPVLIALSGPQGTGKTLSALRLASGLVGVTGGDVWVVDTENERAREYGVEQGQAPRSPHTFRFRHLDFQPPFNGRAYRDALVQCQNAGAGCVIFDSVSHEHAGEGGRIEHHAQECERLMKAWRTNDIRKVEWPAWNAPSEERRAFLWALGRRTCHVILCFRAKDSTAKGADNKVIDAGFTPIGAEEYLFEVDSALPLPPQCNGVPRLADLKPGELAFVRLKRRHRGILDDGEQLSEEHGRRLAIAAGWKIQNKTVSPQEATGGADGIPPSRPAPPLSSTTAGDDFPGDRKPIAFRGVEYAPGDPRAFDLDIRIEDLTNDQCKAFARALRELIRMAPDAARARGWFDRNTPELLRLKARFPDMVAQIEEALRGKETSAPSRGGADREPGQHGAEQPGSQQQERA